MGGPDSPRCGAAAPEDSLLQNIYQTGVYRIFPLMLLYVIGFDLRCEDFQPRAQPPECRNAYSDVVWWSTATSFFTNSILTFLMAPMVGTWSDVVGRRPFLLTSMCLGSAPLAVLLAHLTLGTSLLFYYPACALGGCVSIISITLAYIADLLSPSHRAAGFGGLMASFSVGILIGPAVGGMLTAKTAAWVACGFGASCVVYVFLLVPESLSQEALQEAKSRAEAADPKSVGQAAGLKILFRSPLFKRLTVCLMVSGIVSDGLADLFIQYFKLLFNFDIHDVTMVFELFGLCGLLVQTVILRYMLKWLGETRVLIVGLCSALLQMLFVSMITAKWQAFAAVTLGSLGGMAFPAISSIKANNVADCEQGTIQGALYGAKALATGTGPLLFAAMFAAFTKTDSPFPYFPGAPFLLGSALMLVAIGFALTIDKDAGRGSALLAPLMGDDLEAGDSAALDPDDIAELPVSNQAMVRGDVLGENVEGLLVRGHSHHGNGQPSSNGTSAAAASHG